MIITASDSIHSRFTQHITNHHDNDRNVKWNWRISLHRYLTLYSTFNEDVGRISNQPSPFWTYRAVNNYWYPLIRWCMKSWIAKQLTSISTCFLFHFESSFFLITLYGCKLFYNSTLHIHTHHLIKVIIDSAVSSKRWKLITDSANVFIVKWNIT